MGRHPTPANAILRQLIRQKSATLQGFCRSDADHLEAASNASKTACRMVQVGQLFRGFVPGHGIHYFSSPERAAAFEAREKPLRTLIPPAGSTPASIKMRSLIIRQSALPNGFATADAPPDQRLNTSRILGRMVREGLIFVAKLPDTRARYFATQEAALAWVPEKKPVKKKAYKPKPKAIKPPKPPVVRVARLAKPPKPHQRIVIRQEKPSKPPAGPRIDAEIVHTANTRYSSRMMTDRFAVSVPFVRIGQPGFSMTVGG